MNSKWDIFMVSVNGLTYELLYRETHGTWILPGDEAKLKAIQDKKNN